MTFKHVASFIDTRDRGIDRACRKGRWHELSSFACLAWLNSLKFYNMTCLFQTLAMRRPR